MFESFRRQLVEVRIAFVNSVPAANQTVVGQDDERRAAFAIKLGGPCRPLDVGGRAAEHYDSVSRRHFGFDD